MPPRKSARAAAAAAASASASPAPTAGPLKGCLIVVAGTFDKPVTQKSIIQEAEALGAETRSTVVNAVTHLITSEYYFNVPGAAVKTAQSKPNIKIVSYDWLIACEKANKKLDESKYAPTTAPVANGAAKGKKRAAPSDDGGDDEEEVEDKKAPAKKRSKKDDADEEEEKKPAKGTGKAAAKDKTLSAESSTTDVDEKKPAKAVKKKAIVIPLDQTCPLLSYQVYVDEDGLAFDASLNQTNASNNNNKFYRVQLLFNKQMNDYKTWTRWGRVGESGANAILGGGSLADALKQFDKKFKDKSGLSWAKRLDAPKSGKYTFIERNYSDSDDENDAEEGEDAEDDEEEYVPPESKLDPEVQQLMALIFNASFMQASLSEMGYDSKKLPLGRLAKSTITRGFEKLQELAALFDDNSLANDKYGTPYATAVEQLSNQYYSLIPHDFGRNRPPIISNDIILKKEIDVLDNLGDLKEAAAIMKAERSQRRDTVHEFDRQFAALKTDMVALDREAAEFKNIAEYLTGTRGATHGHSYEVESIFRVQREGEFERFDNSKYASIPSDRRLLWHGSRATNFGGIFSTGLRIAPKEAPVSGYMFGKGIYLADMASKSANYCCSYLSNNTALLLLCEAELGKPMQELTDASYTAGDDAIAKGLHSTWGKGKIGPKKWKDASCINPTLKGVQMPDVSTLPGDTNVKDAYLMYNEYIAYHTDQVRLRYLLRVRMK